MVKSADAVFTVWLIPADGLPIKLESPLYWALIVCVPTDRVEVERFACPPLSAAVPSVVAPSRKVTVPVGVPLVFEATVAVKVTDCPWVEFGLLDDSDVDVPAWLTVYGRADELLPLKVESPP